MKTFWFLVALVLCTSPIEARAQLVADGETNILDGVSTNVSGNITIGTNGSFTLLALTNSAAVTNTGTVTIGQNASAKSNSVAVAGAGSMWKADGFLVGSSGSFNQLLITNGGMVADGFAYIGQNNSSSNNIAIVTGTGSTWLNSSFIYVGNNGPGNLLIVTNGGAIKSSGGRIGYFSVSNLAIVTGANSIWRNSGLTVGGSFNELLVKDAGMVSSSGSCTIGYYANSNLVLITDPGSLWTNSSSISLGYSGHGNQLIVSNGAVVAATYTYVKVNGGSQQKLIVTGADSLLTNSSDFYLGQFGSSNQLVVADGGKLANNVGYIGLGGMANQALITDANTVWTNRSNLSINSIRNQLVVSNGAAVFNNYGYVGFNPGGSSNSVLVTGAGSLWSNRFDLYIGYGGANNQLLVADAGIVSAEGLIIGRDGANNQLLVADAGIVSVEDLTLGYNTSSTDNNVTLNGGILIVTNSLGLGYGTINCLQGTLTLNSGLVRCQTFWFNNGASSKLVFNGGMLQMHRSTVYNGSALVVGDGTSAATLMLTTVGLNTGGNHTLSKGLLISSNALLTGAGTVNGNVFIGKGGTFAPGTTNVWFVTLNNGLVLSNNCTTVLGLNPFSGSAYHVEGLTNVIYGGTLQLTNPLGGTYASGQSYKLFYSGHYSGAFNNLVPSTPGPDLRWDTNELNIDGVLRVLPAVSSPPVIGSVAIADGNFIINAGSGIAYDPVYLLTSTNLTSPITDWTCWSTNYFDTNGAVNITNVIVPGEPERYFRLQVQ